MKPTDNNNKNDLNANLKKLFSYLVLAIAALILFNAFIYQDNESDYTATQKTTAESIIRVLESKLELPLLVADNQAIEEELRKLEINDRTVSISIFDNNSSLVAERLIDNASRFAEPILYSKEIIHVISISEHEDIFGENETISESQKIGEIQVRMKPYAAYEEYKSNKLAYLYNLVLITILMLIGIWLYIKWRHQSSQLSHITELLQESKLTHTPLKVNDDYQKLYSSAYTAVDRIARQNIQLGTLKQEISYAREDSNLELNRFLEFLMASDKIIFDDNLKVFLDSVLVNKSSEKALVNISKEISLAIARYSDLMSSNNVVIFDNILGKLEDYSVFIDKNIFTHFLDLFFKQMILLCKNSEININADINSIHDDSHMLRLSFESSSPTFRNSLEQQTLFDFIATPEISINTNNADFIACKHLVHKSGGDYIFLQKEIRFEFPVLIEKNFIASSNISSIQPLAARRSFLVYDSDPTERIVLMGYLDKFGQKLDKATTKKVTLQKIRRNQYDILCVNSDFFSDQDPYFLTNFKSEYLAIDSPPLLLVISSNDKIIENDYFQSFNAKLLTKPIDLESLKNTILDLT